MVPRRVKGDIPAGAEHFASVIARVLYTRYCAMELSTRIFAVIQRLARDVHIPIPTCSVGQERRVSRARSPNWKRVANLRHEFRPKSAVASVTHESVGAAPRARPAAVVSLPVYRTQRVAPVLPYACLMEAV